MKIRPITAFELQNLQRAAHLLREVRLRLVIAQCPRALRRVRSTIASTDGAIRHAHRRFAHTTHDPLAPL